MINIPPQHQPSQPGIENIQKPRPEALNPNYKAAGKLKNKIAIITGGDSGIGRAIAYLFAIEGAKTIITYLNEHEDAKETKNKVLELGGECELIAGDIGEEDFCKKVIDACIKKFGKIDILINNSAEQHESSNILEITKEQLERTFKTNIFSYFYMTKAALKYLNRGSCIINTTSVVAYKGSVHLLDYSATKGAIVTFTRSLALTLVEQEIRVNGVAPGPIWTPLIPASFSEKKVSQFGQDVPIKKPGQPYEVAPCYVFLASEDSSYMTGQILHPNGGVIINA